MFKQQFIFFVIVFFATQVSKICEGKILMSPNSVDAGIPAVYGNTGCRVENSATRITILQLEPQQALEEEVVGT